MRQSVCCEGAPLPWYVAQTQMLKVYCERDMITDPARHVIVVSTYADITDRSVGPFWSEHIVDVEWPALLPGPVESSGGFCSVCFLTAGVPCTVQTHGTEDIDDFAKAPARAATWIERYTLIEVTRSNCGSDRYKPPERLESAKGRSNVSVHGLHPDANDLNLGGSSFCDRGEEPLLRYQRLTR